jgi:hypothetical protein
MIAFFPQGVDQGFLLNHIAHQKVPKPDNFFWVKLFGHPKEIPF